MNKIGLLFVTIGRPDCAMRLIESVHAHHPEIRVYAIEQADSAGVLARRCAELGYHHELAPYDIGVSHCRNVGVERIEEDFFLLADDDFYFRERVDYERMVPLFHERPALLMVGGDLDEEDELNARRPGILLHRGRHILRDATGRGVLLCSTVFLNTTCFRYDGEALYRCDMVAQWALCRTEMFRARKLLWDARFKNNGEHLDFFMMLQSHHPDLEILYWPGLRCAHAPGREGDYAELRMRRDWQAAFAEKWQLDYQGNLGGAIRCFHEGLEIAHRPDDAKGSDTGSASKLKAVASRQKETIQRKNEKIARLEALLGRR